MSVGRRKIGRHLSMIRKSGHLFSETIMLLR